MKRYLFLAILLFLSACGQPDSSAPSGPPSSLPAQADRLTIADLRANPPAPGITVSLDAYNWNGFYRRSTYLHDEQNCPLLVHTSILTDWPVVGALHLPTMGRANWSADYPPDDDPWLIPTFISPVETATTILPYHARLRGHFGDPAFAHCAHADRLFVVEQVETVYQELPPPESQMASLTPPADYPSWQHYHDAAMGYSFAYAPTWSVEPLQEAGILSAVAVRIGETKASSIVIRVYAGETYLDPYEPDSRPSLLQGDMGGRFSQEIGRFVDQQSQQLVGHWVDRKITTHTHEMSIVISGANRSYVLNSTYAIGLNAQQPLIDAYTLIIASFRLDTLPGPTPTPPIRQTIGAGPFISQEQAFAEVRRQNGDTMTLLDAKLVSEREVRQPSSGCYSVFGHFDGIWLVRLRGPFEGLERTMIFGVDAVTGEQLCGYEEAATAEPTPLPGTMWPTATAITPSMIPFVTQVPQPTMTSTANQPYLPPSERPSPTTAPYPAPPTRQPGAPYPAPTADV